MGSSASQELTIHNNSDCSLHYNLLIDQRISGPYDDEESARDVLGKQVQSPHSSQLIGMIGNIQGFQIITLQDLSHR